MKLGELINTPLPAAGGRIPTGMRDLDALVGGLPVGHVSTIAAYPGMGTTAFAVSLVRNVAVFGGVPAVYFTNDKSEMDIAQRFVKAGGGRLRVTDGMVSDAGLVEAAQRRLPGWWQHRILGRPLGIPLFGRGLLLCRSLRCCSKLLHQLHRQVAQDRHPQLWRPQPVEQRVASVHGCQGIHKIQGERLKITG